MKNWSLVVGGLVIFAFVAAALFRPQEQAVAAPPAVGWEYKVEPVYEKDIGDAQGPGGFDGMAAKATAKMNKRGEDGWELIAITPPPKNVGDVYGLAVFKRPAAK